MVTFYSRKLLGWVVVMPKRYIAFGRTRGTVERLSDENIK